MRRIGLVSGALVCVALAGILVLLAADVWRWGDAIAADDVRYRAAMDVLKGRHEWMENGIVERAPVATAAPEAAAAPAPRAEPRKVPVGVH